MFSLYRKYRGRITVAAVLLTTLGLGLFLVSLWTVDEVFLSEPSLHVSLGELPKVSARSFLVLDIETNTEIISQAANQELPIASITKLFAAAAFREETGLVGTTTITWGDVATEGRAGKLQAGEIYPYHELIQAMLVESSNDAASTIARTDEGLLQRMNNYPDDLNLSSTTFADASGLSDQDQSTAFELAQLTRSVWYEQPHLFDVSNQEEIIGTYTGWINNNPFVGMSGYKGGKHGYTLEANRTAVAVFEESISGTKRDILYVLLGSDDLVADIEQLRAHVGKHVTYD